MRVTFNSLAERELNDAIQYYENEQAGLGAALLAEVRRSTTRSSSIQMLARPMAPIAAERQGVAGRKRPTLTILLS